VRAAIVAERQGGAMIGTDGLRTPQYWRERAAEARERGGEMLDE